MTDWQVVPRARRDLLGEGPLWAPRENALYWVDILDRRINRLALDGGQVASWIMPEMVGWVVERVDVPGLAAGFRSGVKGVILDPLTIEPLVDLPDDEPAINRMNDAKVDRQGRLWAGTMPLTCDQPTGSLYRIDGSGIARMDDGYHVANGPAISPDGCWLYHTNTVLGHIYRFPLRDGSLGARELFLEFPKAWGNPDGMTFDADGGLWVAHWGGSRISRLDPEGRVERERNLPASQITSMAFAGEHLDRLFVTSAADGVDEPAAGCLFEVDPGVRGLAPHRYAG